MGMIGAFRSDGGYTKLMKELSEDYEIFLREARRTLRENNGEPSTREAEFYSKAAKKCEEIMAMNLSERNIHDQWRRRHVECERRIQEITDALVPRPATPVHPAPKPEMPVKPATPVQAKEEKRETDTTAKTEDGFTTRNASADVPAEMIASWYQKAPEFGLESIVGMEKVTNQLLAEAAGPELPETDELLGISPVQSYFLYGPPGTGKTTFINAFVKELMRKDNNFKFISLTGSEIHNSYVGVAEKIVTAAFAEAVDNAPCVIFLDEVEGLCANRSGENIASHEKRLTNAFLEARNKMNASKKKVVFFGATNHPSDVDPAMLDSVKTIYIPLPDEKSRAEFFRKRFSKFEIEDNLSYEEMAERTDMYSFRELKRLAEATVVALKSNLLENYQVLDAEGKRDDVKTDRAISEAFASGKVKLSRALFEEKLQELPAKDKTATLRELAAFEGNLADNA